MYASYNKETNVFQWINKLNRARSPFPFSMASLMCSFQRPRSRDPWSSGETTDSCFFAPAARWQTPKTTNSIRSSEEELMVKHIRKLPADEVQQSVMSKQVRANVPLPASHFYLLVLPWGLTGTRRDTWLHTAAISHISEVVSTNRLNTRAARQRLTTDSSVSHDPPHSLTWSAIRWTLVLFSCRPISLWHARNCLFSITIREIRAAELIERAGRHKDEFRDLPGGQLVTLQVIFTCFTRLTNTTRTRVWRQPARLSSWRSTCCWDLNPFQHQTTKQQREESLFMFYTEGARCSTTAPKYAAKWR